MQFFLFLAEYSHKAILPGILIVLCIPMNSSSVLRFTAYLSTRTHIFWMLSRNRISSSCYPWTGRGPTPNDLRFAKGYTYTLNIGLLWRSRVGGSSSKRTNIRAAREAFLTSALSQPRSGQLSSAWGSWADCEGVRLPNVSLDQGDY